MSQKSRIGYFIAALKANESTPGILLVLAMIVAMVLDNSSLSGLYDSLLSTQAGLFLGDLGLNKPLLLWINDGLMAVFFLLIGLEVKREIVEGHLSKPSEVILPGIAAVGGMLVPALVYYFINRGDAQAMEGWAIPVATDIAFALGILSLFGSRVPVALKVFLLSLAVIDDLGAIVIIAVFYTSNLSILSLSLAGVAVLGLVMLNLSGVRTRAAYCLVGAVLWVCVLKSGVHATLAGVVMAFAIPIKQDAQGYSPLKTMEHSLHPWVMLMIMPIFAFANAGVSLKGLSLEALLAPIPLGIAAGLFLGKQIGVFGFSFIAVKMGLCKLPEDVNWTKIYAVSLLTGIGFTMSLFVSSLAFAQSGGVNAASDRLGILLGSLLSAVGGSIVMYIALRGKKQVDEPAPKLA